MIQSQQLHSSSQQQQPTSTMHQLTSQNLPNQPYSSDDEASFDDHSKDSLDGDSSRTLPDLNTVDRLMVQINTRSAHNKIEIIDSNLVIDRDLSAILAKDDNFEEHTPYMTSWKYMDAFYNYGMVSPNSSQ